MSEAVKTVMIIAVEIAIYATVLTLAVIFFVLWIRKMLNESENTCAYCGDPCEDEFCCKSHELLFYDEEDLAREEIIHEEEDGKDWMEPYALMEPRLKKK